MGRRLRIAALLVVINGAAALAAVLGYFAWGKLTYEAYYCAPFGRLDAEAGWMHEPNATSCIGGRAPFSSAPPWFEASVFSDRNGFRAAVAGGETTRGGVLFVGDSWTFGYGVPFEQSFPGQMQARTGIPSAVAASPGYGAAQAMVMAERWAGKLAPKAIVYLELGLWERSACRGGVRPTSILKPCYWQPPGSASAELVLPQPGAVERAAAWGLRPGGMLAVGEVTWPYFLWARPIAQTQHLLVRLGLMAGFGHDFYAVGVDEAAIRRGVLDHAARIAEAAKVPFLIVDRYDTYAAFDAARPANLHRIGRQVWDEQVDAREASLPPGQARVPHDGHFGPEMNALVAGLIEERLKELGVTGKP